MRFVFSTAQRLYSSRTWFNVGRNFNRAPVYDYPGISSSFHLQASIPLSREHIKTEITGNFLHHLTDGLKKEASVFGILTQFALAQRAVVFLGFWGKIFLDIMKVISAVLLVAVFWSQEWKSTLSDSIIHIGKLLRFSSSKSQPERDSLWVSQETDGMFQPCYARCFLNHSVAGDIFGALWHKVEFFVNELSAFRM